MVNRFEPDASQVTKGVVYYSKPISQIDPTTTAFRIDKKDVAPKVEEKVAESPKEETVIEEVTVKEVSEDELPEDLSVKKTFEWVGDDANRAETALKSEKDSEFPRSTLVKGLEEIANN